MKYSSAAYLFLFIRNNLDAQAVYNDLDPDIELTADLDTKFIDMDFNGTTDFIFFNWSYSTITSFGIGHLYQRLFVGPNIHDNGIIGSKIATYYETNCYPYALTIGEPINLDDDFQTSFFQKMAFRSYASFGPSSNGGNWYPDMLDKYLGVRFIDEMNCYHYGWIRCDVKDEGRTLIIKDYAYETKCDTGIIMGDTIGDTSLVGIDNEILQNSFEIFSNKNSIFVEMKTLQNNSEVYIFDINGNKILLEGLHLGINIFTIESQTGIYLVKIYTSRGSIINKVLLTN